MKIRFGIEGLTPRPQARPRFGKNRVYEPADIAEYKAAISLSGRSFMQGRSVFLTPIAVRIVFRRKRKVDARPDIDNLVKAVLDALNGICFKDDAQIISLHAFKVNTPNEGLDITISDEPDDLFPDKEANYND